MNICLVLSRCFPTGVLSVYCVSVGGGGGVKGEGARVCVVTKHVFGRNKTFVATNTYLFAKLLS